MSFVKIIIRAAFEAVSKVTLRPLRSVDRVSLVDLTRATLPSDRPNYDDFDPRDFREPKSSITTRMAYFNLLRVFFGAGMLGMPLALSQLGIILGPLLIFGIGLLLINMHLTLLECLNEICRQLRIPHISYRYGFRIALLHGPQIFHCVGRRGPSIIATFMILSQMGICTVFVIFTSDSLRDLMDWSSTRPALLIMLFPLLALVYFMKTLKIISYISLMGNMMSMAGLLLVVYHYIIKEPLGEVIYASNHVLPLLFAFGTVLFNFCAVGVILAIDKALKDPRELTKRYGVIEIGIFVPTVVSIVFGFLGYWVYGTMEENIMRSLPYDDVTTMLTMVLLLIAVGLGFPIQCYPAIQIVLEVIKNFKPDDPPTEHTLNLIEKVARPAFVLICFGVCYVIPFQAPFVAFVGNLCTTLLVLVFPALMDLCLRHPDHYGTYNYYLIKNLSIIIIGLCAWASGAGLCAYIIYVRFLSLYSPNVESFN